MKPKWQRARVVDGGHYKLTGAIIWVECARPEFARGRTPLNTIQSFDALWSNLLDDTEDQLGVPAAAVELLARDENDFAEIVPMVSLRTFLAEFRKAREQ